MGKKGTLFKIMLAIIFIICFSYSGGLALSDTVKCKNYRKRVILNINGRPLYAEVASTPEERRRGLMFREELGDNEGMLFVFEQSKKLSFWMKNTGIPLSIAFIDEKGIITEILNMKPFSLDPVESTKKCMFALEVNRGFFERCGVVPGYKIDLSGLCK